VQCAMRNNLFGKSSHKDTRLRTFAPSFNPSTCLANHLRMINSGSKPEP
jgi:hypothetical protein